MCASRRLVTKPAFMASSGRRRTLQVYASRSGRLMTSDESGRLAPINCVCCSSPPNDGRVCQVQVAGRQLANFPIPTRQKHTVCLETIGRESISLPIDRFLVTRADEPDRGQRKFASSDHTHTAREKAQCNCRQNQWVAQLFLGAKSFFGHHTVFGPNEPHSR